MVTCPKTGGPCRHCSYEILKTVTRTGDSVKGIRRTVNVQKLGVFCNNNGRKFVHQMNECPIPEALAVPLVPYEPSPLEWMQIKAMRRS
ncbi:MAG: hypothetical protein LUO93_02385 [Methanomicrobiales archaeon]|nr:hypothetical protein [Methanomicrobiales archaeon]